MLRVPRKRVGTECAHLHIQTIPARPVLLKAPSRCSPMLCYSVITGWNASTTGSNNLNIFYFSAPRVEWQSSSTRKAPQGTVFGTIQTRGGIIYFPVSGPDCRSEASEKVKYPDDALIDGFRP